MKATARRKRMLFLSAVQLIPKRERLLEKTCRSARSEPPVSDLSHSLLRCIYLADTRFTFYSVKQLMWMPRSRPERISAVILCPAPWASLMETLVRPHIDNSRIKPAYVRLKVYGSDQLIPVTGIRRIQRRYCAPLLLHVSHLFPTLERSF